MKLMDMFYESPVISRLSVYQIFCLFCFFVQELILIPAFSIAVYDFRQLGRRLGL